MLSIFKNPIAAFALSAAPVAANLIATHATAKTALDKEASNAGNNRLINYEMPALGKNQTPLKIVLPRYLQPLDEVSEKSLQRQAVALQDFQNRLSELLSKQSHNGPAGQALAKGSLEWMFVDTPGFKAAAENTREFSGNPKKFPIFIDWSRGRLVVDLQRCFSFENEQITSDCVKGVLSSLQSANFLNAVKHLNHLPLPSAPESEKEIAKIQAAEIRKQFRSLCLSICSDYLMPGKFKLPATAKKVLKQVSAAEVFLGLTTADVLSLQRTAVAFAVHEANQKIKGMLSGQLKNYDAVDVIVKFSYEGQSGFTREMEATNVGALHGEDIYTKYAYGCLDTNKGEMSLYLNLEFMAKHKIFVTGVIHELIHAYENPRLGDLLSYLINIEGNTNSPYVSQHPLYSLLKEGVTSYFADQLSGGRHILLLDEKYQSDATIIADFAKRYGDHELRQLFFRSDSPISDQELAHRFNLVFKQIETSIQQTAGLKKKRSDEL